MGIYWDGSGVEHGFLFYNGVFTVVDFPAADGTSLSDINDEGVIIGSAGDSGVLPLPAVIFNPLP